jgi:hypothetical protein
MQHNKGLQRKTIIAKQPLNPSFAHFHNLRRIVRRYVNSSLIERHNLGKTIAKWFDFRVIKTKNIVAKNLSLSIVMIWVMNRHKPVAPGRNNLNLTAVLLVRPIVIALTMKKFSVVIVSTIIWQFVLSRFAEEFAFRGYIQSRLNQAFGRPMRLLGVRFRLGLIVASLLFGLLHAFNTFKPAIGFALLGWGW